MKNIISELKQYIYDNILMGSDEDDLQEDTSLLKKGIIDSTGVLELIAFLEQRYQIRVENKDIVPENFDSLSNIEHYLAKKVGQPVAG